MQHAPMRGWDPEIEQEPHVYRLLEARRFTAVPTYRCAAVLRCHWAAALPPGALWLAHAGAGHRKPPSAGTARRRAAHPCAPPPPATTPLLNPRRRCTTMARP